MVHRAPALGGAPQEQAGLGLFVAKHVQPPIGMGAAQANSSYSSGGNRWQEGECKSHHPSPQITYSSFMGASRIPSNIKFSWRAQNSG